MVAPFGESPSRVVTSPDGTAIAVFSAPPPASPDAAARTPILLVHGTTADHRTWRVVGPALAEWAPLHAMDRRGRGDSGDGPSGAYAIERELEDVAAVAESLAREVSGAEGRRGIDVVGHSLGGRIALGASLRTAAIRRIVAYESAPTAGETREPGARDALLEALRGDLARGDHDALLARFMREAVGMSEPDLAAFRADPIWPRRAAAAPTIVRELSAAAESRAIGIDELARVTIPVLQLTGTAGDPSFRAGADALDARIANGRVLAIDGAKHAAHHSHPDAFLAAVEAFLRE